MDRVKLIELWYPPSAWHIARPPSFRNADRQAVGSKSTPSPSALRQVRVGGSTDRDCAAAAAAAHRPRTAVARGAKRPVCLFCLRVPWRCPPLLPCYLPLTADADPGVGSSDTVPAANVVFHDLPDRRAFGASVHTGPPRDLIRTWPGSSVSPFSARFSSVIGLPWGWVTSMW